jgi:hypothetical protein
MEPLIMSGESWIFTLGDFIYGFAWGEFTGFWLGLLFAIWCPSVRRLFRMDAPIEVTIVQSSTEKATPGEDR